MSTRVHELAKELGVKSQDLLDKIQSWGFEVKSSIFAGLDSQTVEKIRARAESDGLTGSAPSESPRAQEAPAAPTPPPPTTPPPSSPAPPAKSGVAAAPPAPAAKTPPSPAQSETPAIRSTAPAAPSQGTTSPATAPAPEPASPAPTAAAPTAPAPANEPTVASPAAAAAPKPAPTAPDASAPTPAPAAPRGAAAPPGPRPGGLNAPPRPAPGASAGPRPGAPAGGPTGSARLGSGSGPLSRHTPHGRGAGPQQGQGQGPGAPQPPQAQAGAPVQPPMPPRPEPRPNPSSPPPLRQSDYISPTGTRAPMNRPMGPSSQQGGMAGQGQQPRRMDDGPRGQDGPRPAAGSNIRRPLPPVAAPVAPSAPRRDAGPRPGARPEQPGQRAVQRFTREEMLAMMQAGTLHAETGPARPGAGPGRPGQGPGRPGMGPGRPGGPGASPRFGSPPAAPMQGRGPGGPGIGPGGIRRPGAPPLPGSGPIAPPAPPTTEEEDDRKGKSARLGSPADRAGRRARRNEKTQERDRLSSPLPAAALLSETDEDGRRKKSYKKGGKHNQRNMLAPTRKSRAEIEPPVSVRSLSEAIGIRANELIRKMMNTFGQMVTINAVLDDESAQMLALEFGVELQIVHERTAEDDMMAEFEDREGEEEGVDFVPRPPVVTILGHVDHGKTSLLDRIRKTNVVDTESGGITQHIGAYQVEHNGHPLTFLDTPGHEAFTAMRARGANVTDIVVLVVAADDGVMPQTQEAIAHAKAADVPIVVALNKIDLPNVNLNKIFGELSQQDLAPEDYGGDTPVIKTSAMSGLGIPELLEMIGIVAELRCDLRSNPARNATGTCLEASISEGRGVVATVLVQDGTLKVGDVIVCGDGFGRVRALFDDKGRSVNEAGPSTPVEVSGLDAVPTAGEKFAVIDDITRAREIAETRRDRTRGVALGERQSITLENLYSKMAEQKVKALNLILKADVQGSLEALIKELEKLENPEVPIRVLLKGVGGISESDVLLADASQAIIIGFRVAPEDRAITAAEDKKIDIRRYDIIYQVTDEVKKAIEGMLVPEIKEVHLGRAVVRQTFKISKTGTVAGCFVTQGLIERSAKARLIREGREIYKGSIEALKRFKDDAKEVREGFECGIKITNFDDLKTDDVIEAYRVDVIRRTL